MADINNSLGQPQNNFNLRVYEEGQPENENIDEIAFVGATVTDDGGGKVTVDITVPTKTSDLINDGEDGINPFVTFLDIPYQIIKLPIVADFPIEGDPTKVYLAEDTGTFYLWNGVDGVYEQITSNAFPTGLERITEGGNTGWRLIGRNPNNYGNIGMNAVDISTSTSASATKGANGQYSFAQGLNTRAFGTSAVSLGTDTQATAQYSFAHGSGSQATSNSAEAGGNSNIASGNSSVAKGIGNRARSFAEFSIGQWGTDYTPISSTSPYNNTDRVFNLGNGLSDIARSDAFTVFKNGAVKLFAGALTSITNGVAGFFTFNSTDSNRPYIHNGTEWKGLAYLDDITGGAVDSVNGQTGVVVLDSDDISEGATNLYFTDARALGAIPDATPTVKGIAKLYTSLGSNTDGAVDQNTVNSALALKANLQNVEQIIRSKSNGTFGSHTGDTAETVIAVIDIDANEFEAGDWMTLLFSCEKDASAGNVTWRLRAGVNGNTSDSQIALLTATSSNSRYSALYRARPQFLTGNQLRIWSAGSSVPSDISVSGAPTLASLTPTSAWKLTVTAQLTVTTETASLTGYRIGKIKSF